MFFFSLLFALFYYVIVTILFSHFMHVGYIGNYNSLHGAFTKPNTPSLQNQRRPCDIYYIPLPPSPHLPPQPQLIGFVGPFIAWVRPSLESDPLKFVRFFRFFSFSMGSQLTILFSSFIKAPPGIKHLKFHHCMP